MQTSYKQLAPPHKAAEEYCGLFRIHGNVPCSELAAIYGLSLPQDIADRTVAELFRKCRQGSANAGRQCAFGPLQLIDLDTPRSHGARFGLVVRARRTIAKPKPDGGNSGPPMNDRRSGTFDMPGERPQASEKACDVLVA
jgi:hypothetical protein